MMTDPLETLNCRRALEALRNGVPNRYAVEMLGCGQPAITDRFEAILGRVADPELAQRSAAANSLLVSGDFGSGKSHLLTHLEHLALEQGFVCSKVAISKETPLYDLGKVFKSAVEHGRLPGRSGMLIEELGQSLNPDTVEYDRFFSWANDTEHNGLNAIFPATLQIYKWSHDFELNRQIEYFWAGDKIMWARFKEGLRQINMHRDYTFRAPKVSELPPQRLLFFNNLIKAAGYKGWVVLLDEIELMGSYSLLQRGRAYAELARWCGQGQGDSYPGLVTVGSVTDDFAAVVIDVAGDKQDRDYVEGKLQERNAHLIANAVTGMDMLERGTMGLRQPDDAEVQGTVDRLRDIYSTAYGWDAPSLSLDDMASGGFQNRMRYKVRASINQWDLMRHYPDQTFHMEGDEFHHTYDENKDLEKESKDDGVAAA